MTSGPGSFLCGRCAAVTTSPIPDRCGRCRDWPDYDPADPTIGDLARLAEHLYGLSGQWTDVVMGLVDAIKAHDLYRG